MRPLTYLEIGAAVLVVIIGGIALYEHDQHVRVQAVAEATQSAQDAYQKQLASLSADFDAKLKARDQQYAADKQAQAARFQNAATPQQIAQLVSQLMGLQKPIQLAVPAPSAQDPIPQTIAQISSLDLPQVKAYVEQCETCKLDLTKTQADLADRAQQAALAQKEIDSLKTQRDTAIVAVRGGTTFQRTIRVIKYLAIGAAAGYIAGKKF